MNKELKELTKTIIKAVPEIMGFEYDEECLYCEGTGNSDRCSCGRSVQKRPITLEDCLIAINEKSFQKEYTDRTFLMVNTNGMFKGEMYNWEEEPVFWEMGIPLPLQSKETLTFLHNILCKK